MNPLFIYFSGEHPYGYGHKYRTGTVLRACRDAGIWTTSITNSMYNLLDGGFGCAIDGDMDSIHFMPAYTATLDQYPQIDWLVFDVPTVPPIEVVSEAKRRGLKIASLHGVGHQHWDIAPDVIWEQDSARNAIVRQDVFTYKLHVGSEVIDESKVVDWVVFGGAADVLKLANSFSQIRPKDSATLIQTAVSQGRNGTPSIHRIAPKQRVTIFGNDRNAFIGALYHSRRGVFHLGMTCWEYAALGKPMYIFSSSDEHLSDALAFERRGLAIAAPQVGFDSDMVRETLAREFTPTGERPDGLGAYRFLDVLSRTQRK